MSGPYVEDRRVVVLRELFAGAALITVCGLAATVLFVDPAGRAVTVAAGCTLSAAWSTNWLARAAVSALSVLIYVMFVARYAGMPTSWPYTPVIGLATMLGAGYRCLAQTGHGGAGQH